MSEGFRVEKDSMGEMRVPREALYGAQTARALENFPISNHRFPRRFIRALGLVKKHAAAANATLGFLQPETAAAIQRAAHEVAEGGLDAHFVLDIFQTGSGTSTNMNANEVIAHRATELLGGERGERLVHPNDHVNLGQSSNDVIPTAIHIAALEAIEHDLLPALSELQEKLATKANEFAPILKIGRTHLQDATPVRLGQVFGGYASQVRHGMERIEMAKGHLRELALGGTAVGTGLNTHPEFASRTIESIAKEIGTELREARDHFEAQSARDAIVGASGALRTVAVSLIKIANDIRWLGSGPRCGLGELKIPATQPGSSIMPGKVNPVMSEMLIQVGVQVIGNDTAISFSGAWGNFELNAMMPVMAHNLLESVALLGSASHVFARRCVVGLEPDAVRCAAGIEQSLAMSTALAPVIGYDAAAGIARQAYETGRTVREIALENSELSKDELDHLLDPERQAGGSDLNI
jgi:fumarate hydratase, class II